MFDTERIISLRNLKIKPVRTLLLILGISLGMAIFVSVKIINNATLQYFSRAVHAMMADSSLTVSGSLAGFSENTLLKIKEITKVKQATPSVQLPGYLRGDNKNEPQRIMIIGIVPGQEEVLKRYKLPQQNNFSAALQNPGDILITRTFADKRSLKTGAMLEILTPKGSQYFKITGILLPSGAALNNAGNIALVNISTAQQRFDYQDKINRIDIAVDGEENIDRVKNTLINSLGRELTIERPETSIQNLQRMVDAYQVQLSFLSLLALFVGSIILASTISISVSEHRRDIGILRAVGATKGKIFWLLQLEAITIGVLGSVIGVIAGRIIAILLVDSVSRSVSNQTLWPIEISELDYDFAMALTHILFGIILAAVTSFWASYKASHVDFINLIRPEEVSKAQELPKQVTYLGRLAVIIVIYLILTILMEFGAHNETLQTTHTVLGAIAAIALAPWLAIKSLVYLHRSYFGKVIANRNTLIWLVISNLIRFSKRTGENITICLICILLTVVVSTIHSSFKHSISSWLNRVMYADLLVSSPGRLFMMDIQPLNENIAGQLNDIKGINVINGYGAMGVRYNTLKYQDDHIAVKAFDKPHPAMAGLPFDILDTHGTLFNGDIFNSPHRSALISENFSRHYHKYVGDKVIFNSPQGQVDYQIAGIVTDFSSPQGVIYLSRDSYKVYWQDELVNFFAIMVNQDTNLDQVYQVINSELGENLGIYATKAGELRRQMLDIVNESFVYTYAIEGAVLVVGTLGLMNATIISIYSRIKEFGVLRAVGITRSSLKLMVILETMIQSLLGTLLAVVLGLGLSYLTLQGIVSAMMGWMITFQPNIATLMVIFAIGTVMGGVASFIPAQYCTRMEINTALNYQ